MRLRQGALLLHYARRMDARHLETYLQEVIHQHRLASIAAEQLNAALQSEVPGATASAFAAAQGILTAAAQVSKLAWADTGRDWTHERVDFARRRAAAVREVIKPAPILQTRAVRNAVEHLDERIDSVYLEDPDARRSSTVAWGRSSASGCRARPGFDTSIPSRWSTRLSIDRSSCRLCMKP